MPSLNINAQATSYEQYVPDYSHMLVGYQTYLASVDSRRRPRSPSGQQVLWKLIKPGMKVVLATNQIEHYRLYVHHVAEYVSAGQQSLIQAWLKKVDPAGQPQYDTIWNYEDVSGSWYLSSQGPGSRDWYDMYEVVEKPLQFEAEKLYTARSGAYKDAWVYRVKWVFESGTAAAEYVGDASVIRSTGAVVNPQPYIILQDPERWRVWEGNPHLLGLGLNPS